MTLKILKVRLNFAVKLRRYYSGFFKRMPMQQTAFLIRSDNRLREQKMLSRSKF